MRTKNKNRVTKWTGVFQTVHFDSVADMLSTANKSQKIKYHREDDGGVTRSEFIGRYFISWEDCFKKSHEPYQDGIDTVMHMIEEIENGDMPLPKPKNIKRRGIWSEDDGDDVSLDRMRNGDAFWRKMQRREVTGSQTVSVFCTVNAPGSYDSSKLLWRGVAAIVLAHLLEKAGYRVELFGVQYNMDTFTNHDSLFASCCLKRANQPLDIASITNAISGWFYRTVWMQSIYHFRPKEIRSDFGISMYLSDTNEYVRDLAGKNETIVIDNVYYKSGVVDAIKDAIKKIDKIVEKPIAVLEEQQETIIGGTKLEKKKKVKRTRPVYYGDDE